MYKHFFVYGFVSEIHVDMNGWVLTCFELVSMFSGKWVVGVIILMMASMLSYVDNHHYLFNTTFEITHSATPVIFTLFIAFSCFLLSWYSSEDPHRGDHFQFLTFL